MVISRIRVWDLRLITSTSHLKTATRSLSLAFSVVKSTLSISGIALPATTCCCANSTLLQWIMGNVVQKPIFVSIVLGLALRFPQCTAHSCQTMWFELCMREMRHERRIFLLCYLCVSKLQPNIILVILGKQIPAFIYSDVCRSWLIMWTNSRSSS